MENQSGAQNARIKSKENNKYLCYNQSMNHLVYSNIEIVQY